MTAANSATPDIVAVVVTHRSGSTIDACLTRLRAADGVAQIRVVDNASDDTTLAIVQRHASLDPRVHFIGNPDNPGFAVACNQGARDGDAPWIAFVNPDCLVDADSLARLRMHADALAAPCLLGTELVGEDGARDPAARRRDPEFAAMLRDPQARVLAVPRDAAQPLQRVQAISGALMLLPRTLFDRIDGFDTGYRLHAEDLDLCRRAREAGAVIAVANDIAVLHVRGVSSRSRPVFVEWHKHRGLWRYFQRFEAAHRNWPQRVAVWAMIWARFPIAVLRRAVQAAG
ncbi:glycosyltransferase family 2 protein [Luteimonas fraxinea]|uniref:Glycosyltransferase family 2 protein n=1 Tax=Luteimonas fraxinea TaxID=2901869 RepID=A0ABS8UAI5_9GAMM|nr:glycosyltransferase family 2 protein [Luteimonas fraxinea]MCD9095756.1 glycosyltransferase family 2 protein [Luteimonas fraxinea]UHH11058.1 glycosyltransferase family 2 protein [Luteimonas fraxinea]